MFSPGNSISPLLLAALQAAGTQQQGQVDPLAPLPDAPQAPQPSPQGLPQLPAPSPLPQASESPQALPAPPTSVNDGINSVGRPADANAASLAATAAIADKAANRAKLLKKLQSRGQGEALMAFGAAMMSSRNFGTGLAQGLQAYQQAMSSVRDRWDPKHETVGDGSYERITDPVDDSVTYQETPLRNYNMEKIDRVTGRQIAVAETKTDGALKVEGAKGEHAMERTKFEWGSRKSIEQLRAQVQKDIAEGKNDTAEAVAKIRATSSGHRANSGIEKQITELSSTRDTIAQTLQNSGPVLDAINKGTLNFGMASNAYQKGVQAGILPRNEQSTLYGQFTTLTESLRNAVLLANKGVQTDGDADRAMAEILAGHGDGPTIKKNLEIVIQSLNRRLGTATQRIRDLGNSGSSSAPEPSSSPSRDDLYKKYHLK